MRIEILVSSTSFHWANVACVCPSQEAFEVSSQNYFLLNHVPDKRQQWKPQCQGAHMLLCCYSNSSIIAVHLYLSTMSSFEVQCITSNLRWVQLEKQPRPASEWFVFRANQTSRTSQKISKSLTGWNHATLIGDTEYFTNSQYGWPPINLLSQKKQ